ncbi:lactosylceramide 4-alpha-galactosyltransferase-like [Argiope bruennichi]|uniref:lactosylceramide 4-alpha-galactosyltransferase-like n=1 Tax=Argiope bruennichi TaxID=94029 RepID=UPI0024946545|nr:lactosylceramide 4-alpha-galactosyltransferase-like [Argiope bruennichi]XP_055930171.1 lactosylceramide 4-alpha-galactosyltransferase-like [Argiope bruennichi]
MMTKAIPWKAIRKLLGVFIIFVCFFFIYSPDSGKKASNKKSCKIVDYACRDGNLLKGALGDYYCVNESIFFVETSFSNVLTPRQACAIESTAHHNPSFQVYVLMTPIKAIDFSDSYIKIISTLTNVHLVHITIEDLVCGSPVWKWFVSEKWKKSKWQASHLSDALRFFLIWKYGGMYLDMDIVCLRSMEHLRNIAITENWERVASGILIFQKGHELMKRCMYDFVQKYDSSNFVANGPGTITRNIKAYCDMDNIGKISGADCNVDILQPAAAFPIPYDKWQDYFIPTTNLNISLLFDKSYLIHVWNKFSKISKMKVGLNSLYELAMAQHCPLVYKHIVLVGYAK